MFRSRFIIFNALLVIIILSYRTCFYLNDNTQAYVYDEQTSKSRFGEINKQTNNKDQLVVETKNNDKKEIKSLAAQTISQINDSIKPIDKACIEETGPKTIYLTGNTYFANDWTALGHLPRDIGGFAYLIENGITFANVYVCTDTKRIDTLQQWNDILKDWFRIASLDSNLDLKIYHEDHCSVCVSEGHLYREFSNFFFRTQDVATAFQSRFYRFYKLEHKPQEQEDNVIIHLPEKLKVLIIQRSGKRAFTDIDKFANDLKAKYDRYIIVRTDLLKQPYKDQAALFAWADVIIMAHGAAQSSLIALHPGAYVIECYPIGFVSRYYSPLIRQLRLDHKSWTPDPSYVEQDKVSNDCFKCRDYYYTSSTDLKQKGYSATCRDCNIQIRLDVAFMSIFENIVMDSFGCHIKC